VCFVGASPDGAFTFVAGWDSSARVFAGGREVAVLRHERFAVWSVTAGPDCFFTAGGDSSIRKFSRSGAPLASRPDAHAGPVRLVNWEGDWLLSVSNDGAIAEWDCDLNAIRRTFVSADGLFAFAVLDSAARRYAVGGNGRAVFVVEDGAHVDTFPLGAEVWGLGVLRNGDVVAAADDGLLYALTHSPERRAFDAMESGFFAKLAAPAFRLPDMPDVAMIPEFGSLPGAVESQPTLFRSGAKTVLAAYLPGYRRWAEVATVLPPERSADADGRRWDVIVDVSIGDGQPVQLCFNRGESEYVIARRFLAERGLGFHHLETIAAYLRVQAARAVAGAPFSSLRPAFGDAPPVVGDGRQAVAAVTAAVGAGDVREVLGQLRAVVRAEDARERLPRGALPQMLALVVQARGLEVLADHFAAFGDETVDGLVAGDVIGSLGQVEPGEAREYARFILNFACYASRKPDGLAYIAGKIEMALRNVSQRSEQLEVLMAADVAATYAPQVIEKLAPVFAWLQSNPELAQLPPVEHLLSLKRE
jgi:hypothetical protein